ncbi:transglutaminase domain-containing protein, partial [Candidatus Woesearchaeota archaeon]|nr:transglutaminase domain-containing protein [Candidatus Woesearchaeota archaeon]
FEENEKSEVIEKKDTKKKLWIIWLIIILILMVCIFGIFQPIIKSESTEISILKESIRYENETLITEEKFDFFNLTRDKELLNYKEILVYGRLGLLKEKNSDLYITYVLDDSNRKIELKNVKKNVYQFFIKDSITEDIYEVSGVFKKGLDSVMIDIEDIELYERKITKKIIQKEIIEEFEEIQTIEGKMISPSDFLINEIKKEFFNSCDDGSEHNSCSLTKPLYCKNGNLRENPTQCGCPENKRVYENTCIPIIKCDDGTLAPECSKIKKMQCYNGEWKFNSKCGCPEGYAIKDRSCSKICEDKTFYGECSKEKPLFCDEGILIEKSSLCKCPIGTLQDGEKCVDKYQIQPKEIELKFSFQGRNKIIKYIVYKGLNDYLSGLDRSISYYDYESPPSIKDFALKKLDNTKQRKYLLPLVEEIKKISDKKDDQAKIAISIVQHIPYDWEGFKSNDLTGRYPYEVLYDKKGVCGEKSKLTAFLLRELGFGISLINFDLESHEAVGLKCPIDKGYKGTEYCFVEVTRPTTINHVPTTYVGVGELKSTPKIVVISDGYTYGSI